jgi:hypothetical protein
LSALRYPFILVVHLRFLPYLVVAGASVDFGAEKGLGPCVTGALGALDGGALALGAAGALVAGVVGGAIGAVIGADGGALGGVLGADGGAMAAGTVGAKVEEHSLCLFGCTEKPNEC